MLYQIHQQDAELRGEKRGIAIGEKRGEARGEKRGEERGEKREKIRNATGMLRENIPIDVISRITGLSIADINRLKSTPNPI